MNKPNYKEIFEGKKITQMGLGLLGGGTGDAEFLAKHGAELLVTDVKTQEQLESSVKKLNVYKNITFRLGEHREDDFVERDFILKGPSIPIHSPYLEVARRSGTPIDMSASLFVRIAGVPVIGVTGTRGKSTVVHLLHAMLEKQGRKVLLGGNVKGASSLQLLDQVDENSVGVFELDSWKCQGFGEEKSIEHREVKQGAHSPQVAVFTTFMPDHMNYYKGDMDAYLSDKANIFLHQNAGDVLVVGSQALPVLEKFKKGIKGEVVVAGEGDVPKGWKINLLGEHNRYNVGVAIATARAFGVDEDVIQEVVESIEALPGRLEFVREVKGVRYYNDTNATTPEAVIAALKAFAGKDIYLIAGGADKELDTQALIPAIEKYAKKAVFLQGSGTKKLLEDRDEGYEVAESLAVALQYIQKYVREGAVVLLSPGFSSFGMFTNEYDRGAQYNALVEKM